MKATAPSRSSGTFSIQAGLLSIPVKLYTAVEDDAKIKREQYTADGRKVGMQPAIKNNDGTYGDSVKKDEIVKKFATPDGLVDLDNDEIERIVTGTKGVADIIVAHPTDVLSAYFLNGLCWQVRAEPAGEKAYTILLRSLEMADKFLVLRWSAGGCLYIGALFSDGLLMGLRYDDEVREERPLPRSEVSIEELQLGLDLITTVVRNEDKALEINHPHALVRKYAYEKAAALAKNGDAPALPAPTTLKVADDLMATLRASIAAAASAREAS